MSSNKIARISVDIQRELSKIMITEAKDETLKHVTITGCEVTSDLGLARVYYTYMGDESLEAVAENLKVAEPYLRTVLANTIDIRHTPELRFIFDNSIEYGQNIERILNRLHEEEKEKEKELEE